MEMYLFASHGSIHIAISFCWCRAQVSKRTFLRPMAPSGIGAIGFIFAVCPQKSELPPPSDSCNSTDDGNLVKKWTAKENLYPIRKLDQSKITNLSNTITL
nr:hypothetical protein CFP56_73803 [Quercus suber]